MAIQLKTLIAGTRQAYIRKGLSQIEQDAILAAQFGKTLDQAWDSRELSKMEDVLRAAAKPAPAPAPVTAPVVDPATGVVADAPKATERQVEYAAELLGRRAQSGEGGGYVGTSRFVAADSRGRYTVDMAGLRGLTRPEISRLIDSLKGNY